MKPVRPGVILEYLKHNERRHQFQSVAAVVGGAVLSLVGPLLITLFNLMFSMTLIASHGFWGAYLIIAAVTLPIFFLIAYSLRGSVLEHTVPDGDSISGMFMQRWIAPMLVVVEIANFGPRMVIWGIERLMGHQRVSGTGLGRIAQAVEELTRWEEGISPAKLLFPEEPPEELETLLAYLLYHQIVDVSSRGNRVWLLSEVRDRLRKMPNEA